MKKPTIDWELEPAKTRFLKEIKYAIEGDKANLETWNTKFAKDPTDAFEWGDEAFRIAARLKVLKCVEEMLENEETEIEEVASYINKTVVRLALYPRKSSSDCSNIMYVYGLKAWAELEERITKYKGVGNE